MGFFCIFNLYKKSKMTHQNLDSWNNSNVTNEYEELNLRFDGEVAHLEFCKELIENGRILDLGIGAGRTTGMLFPRAKEYIGIDYSQDFVNRAQVNFPKADIRLGDARDLSVFEDESFDVVFFSFNGIDYIDLEGRMNCLKEVNRVLKKDGHFIFSTHNRSLKTFNQFTSTLRHENGFIKLKSFVKSLRYYPIHIKMKQSEEVYDQYAIINDSAHNFSLLTFYITKEEQQKQLEFTGFQLLSVMDDEGGRDPKNFINFDFLQYLAKKV